MRSVACVVLCTLVYALITLGYHDSARDAQAQALASVPGAPTPSAALQPQIHNLRFKRFTLNDGLSQSTINCIAQDQQGFMWFGTQDGLNRYDGYTFKVYQHKPDNPNSLSHNYVTYCAVDKRDVLWVFTNDLVLHRYDPRADRFQHYTLKLDNPLNQSLFSRLFDGQGHLWVGSQGGGIARYDPDKDAFTYYRHDPNDPHSLGSDVIQTFYEDHAGVIWIGTHTGLNRYDPATDSFVRYPYRAYPPDAFILDPIHEYDPAFAPNDPYALSAPSVSAIFEDSAGSLWVGTWYGGLNRLDRSTGRFTHYPFVHSDSPFDQTQCDSNVPANTFTGNSVSLIQEDRWGRLWIVMVHRPSGFTPFEYSRLHGLDPKTGEVVRYCHYESDPCSIPWPPAVIRIYPDQAGNLWFHTYGGGVDIWDEQTGCFVHYRHDAKDPNTLSDDGVTAFYHDRSGGVWIGTEAGGVNLYDPSWTKFAHYLLPAVPDERASNNSIVRFYADPDSLDTRGQAQVVWVSTSAGLNRWDRRTGTFTFNQVTPHVPDNVVNDMVQDSSGTLWLATSAGLFKSASPITQGTDLGTMTFTGVITRSNALTGWATAIRPDPYGSGHLWVGLTGIGLVHFDPATQQVHKTLRHDPANPNSLSNNEISRVLEGQDRTFWIVTQAGLDHFNPATESFVHYSYDNQRDDILSVYEDKAGEVWVGTNSRGLQHLDPASGAWTDGRQAYALPYNTVYGSLPDAQGNLWLSTNNGLIKFNAQTGARRVYTWRDGLQSNEFNVLALYQTPDGEMFFGGVNGLNVFYPERIQDSPYVPPIVLTSLTQGREQVALDQPVENVRQVTFRWPDNSFEFEFAALSFSQPDKNQYAYKLEGFDRNWNMMGTQRYGRYTNLPGGTYTLRLRGANHDGVWNEQGVSVQITIVPPVWETWWFKGIVVLTLLAAVIGGYRLRINSVEARNRDLQARIEQRTAELRQETQQRLQIQEALRQSETEKAVAAERSRLARDLHDVVSQTLFSAGLVAEALPSAWKRDPEEGQRLLQELRLLTQGALAEMRTLLMELRPVALLETSLGDLLRQLAEAASGREGIPVQVSVENQGKLPPDVHIAFYRIAQEALNNVAKHARARQVTVNLHCTLHRAGAEQVELGVSDDGRGFDPARIPPDHLGLGIMRERAESVGATLSVESSPGQGTRITVIWTNIVSKEE